MHLLKMTLQIVVKFDTAKQRDQVLKQYNDDPASAVEALFTAEEDANLDVYESDPSLYAPEEIAKMPNWSWDDRKG